MRIDRVKLRNYRSYGNDPTTIEFRPGLNVLLGRIGSGKSSILESILISLFGFTRSGIRKNDVLRTDATSEDFQIELTFFFDNTHFKVLRGNENRLESSPDGQSWTLISENSRDIDEFIETTLEVSAKKFRDLFYSAQGELTKVIIGSPEERQKSIDKLLGAESLRETYEALSEFVKYFDNDIGKAEGELSSIESYLERHDLDELRDSKRKEEREIIQISSSIQELKSDIASKSLTLESRKSDLKPMEAAMERIQSLSSQIATRKSNLEAKRSRIKEIRDEIAETESRLSSNSEKLSELRPVAEELEAATPEKESEYADSIEHKNRASSLRERESRTRTAIERLGRELASERQREEKLKAHIGELEKTLSESTSRREETARKIEERNRQLSQLRDAAEKREKELNESQIRAGTLRDRRAEIEARMENLESLPAAARCPFCEQKVTADHRKKVLIKLTAQLRETEKEEEKSRAAVRELKSEIDELNREVESTDEAIRRLERSKTEMVSKIARTDQDRANSEGNLAELGDRRRKLAEDLEQEEASLTEIRGEVDAIRSELGLKGADWISELSRHTDELKDEVNSLRERLSDVRSSIRTRKGMIEQDENRKTTLERLLRETSQEASELESSLESAQEELRAAYEPLIGEADDPKSVLGERISSLKAEIETISEELGGLQVRKAEHSSEFRRKEDLISKLAERIEEYLEERRKGEKARERMTVFSEAKNLLQQIRDKYKDAREMIRTNLINVLRETMRVEFVRLYSYEDFHDVEVSDDYEVSLLSPSLGQISAHNLSAGQKAIVAIAFRLAVAKAMDMKIGCWIVDEPTQNIGKSEVEALANVLADTKEIPQIVVATHHESLGRHGNVISLELNRGLTVQGDVGSERFHE